MAAVALEEYYPSQGQLPQRIPPAPYRHAAPCGPWPWQNLDDPIPTNVPASKIIHRPHDGIDWDPGCEGCHWANYPESLYPNWKADQVERSKMITTFPESGTTTIYQIDIDEQGCFHDKGRHNVVAEDWEKFQRVVGETSKEHRLRAFFFDSLTVSVMQMVGTKYNVEPFFWTSSVNWIPARYQESSKHGIGDHITITLKFPRTVPLNNRLPLTISESNLAEGQIIDTQRPLPLIDYEHQKANILIIDYLAVHMIRDIKGSTLLTYHPAMEWKATTAANLHTRVYLAGQSVYWQKIFQKSSDPTFMFLATLWYSLYAWDEAFEMLWEYICLLESRVIHTNESKLTHELHKIRAHLLHYGSLLEDFYQAVIFVRDTANPAMEAESRSHEKETSCSLLKAECGNLLMQIERLQMSRGTWDSRLQNVMHLVFSTVNIQDSKQMQKLTTAAVRDSAAMKQISYLTMVFLPASFIAGCFGMNIAEINPGTFGTLGHYFAAAIPLTVLTVWVFVAYQGDWHSGTSGGVGGLMLRFMWPYIYVRRYIGDRWLKRPDGSESTMV